MKIQIYKYPSLLGRSIARHMQYTPLDGDVPKILRASAVRRDIFLVKAERPTLLVDVVVNRRQLLGLIQLDSYWSGRTIELTFKILIQMEKHSR